MTDPGTGELTRFTIGRPGTPRGAHGKARARSARQPLCPTPFNAVAVSEDADRMAAVDSTGRVYLLNVGSNRWTCIASRGTPGSAIAFSPGAPAGQGGGVCAELVVGFADGSICAFSVFNATGAASGPQIRNVAL